jgi:hypothetical protein
VSEFKNNTGIDITKSDTINEENDKNKKIKDGKIIIEDAMKLTNYKSKLDLFTTLAQELLHKIQNRKLDEFFAIEEGLIENLKIDQKVLSSLLDEKGNFFDKIRLFLILNLTNNNGYLSNEDYNKFLKSFNNENKNNENEKSENNLISDKNEININNFLNLIKKFKNKNNTENKNVYKYITNSITNNLKFFGETISFGIQNYNKKFENKITKIVSSLMLQSFDKDSSEMKNYIYIDPKYSNKKLNDNNFDNFENSIVFIIGSTNFDEYQNLKNFNKNIILGSTEILNTEQFLSQLNISNFEF